MELFKENDLKISFFTTLSLKNSRYSNKRKIMKTIILTLILILAAAAFFCIRYFMSDSNPDEDIKINNSNRMMSRYKNK